MVTVLGAILGVLVGTMFGFVLTAVLPDSFVDMTVIPWGTIVVILALAALMGTVAGLLPARRAADDRHDNDLSHDSPAAPSQDGDAQQGIA